MTLQLDQPLCITALGARSAVGATAQQTGASVRAALSGFAEHAFYESLSHDPEWEPGEPLLTASAGVDPELEGPARLLELAVPALVDLGKSAGLRRADLATTGLLVSLPVADGAVAAWGLQEQFVDPLCKATGFDALGHVATTQVGHCGVFELFVEAGRLLRAGTLERCIVLGVDSYLCPQRLALWDEAWRLRSERAADGFIPGEAAGALLVETADAAANRGARPLACIEAIGIANEPRPFGGDEVSSGAGLSEVLLDVGATGKRSMVCDLNGESYRAFEWGVARVRLGEALESVETLEHPADCYGDIGAATGALLASYAAFRYSRPLPPDGDAILWTASDGGERAAMRLAPPPAQANREVDGR